MTDDKKAQALAFLGKGSIGVLATVSASGTPRARSLYYASNDEFEVFFMTLADTRKVEDINANHRAAFVVTDESVPETLQMEGVLSEQPDTSAIDPVVQKLMDTFMKRGPDFAPLTHLDQTNILFYKITPTWIRFGDFTAGNGTDKVFATITP